MRREEGRGEKRRGRGEMREGGDEGRGEENGEEW